MRRLLSLLTLWLPLAWLALPVATQPAAGQDASTAAGGYTVRGTVVNALTAQPIARALVALNQDNAMLTDSDGAFSFTNIPAGGYSLSISKPGFRGHGSLRGVIRVARGGAPPHPEPAVRIEVGPDMPAFTVAISPLGSIAGHVTLSTADPADGIRIQAYVRRLQNGRPQWVMAGTARTRSDGSFRIAGLDAGSYMLSTMASLDRPGSATNSREPSWGYPSLYYPGVTEVAAAGLLTLGAGQQSEADLTLVRQQFFPVAAVVRSSTDSPANFEILDSGGRPTGLAANWDRREGIVRAAVPNGTWTMEAHAYGREMQWGSTSFQVNGAPVSFAIAVVPSPHIPVVIRRDFDASQDGAQPAPSGPGMNLSLVSAEEVGLGRGATDNTLTGDGNSYDLTVMEPGKFWVQAQPFPPAYISSITSGGVDLASNPLVLQPGGASPPIEITLRDNGGSITGQVAGLSATAGPAPAAGQRPQLWIYAIPLFATSANLPEGSVQANGQFTIPNLAPGSYRVVACDTQQQIDFHSPEGLAGWTGKGQTVTVDPGGTASVDLDVTHTTAGAPQ